MLLEGLRITSTARRRPWGHTRWQIPQMLIVLYTHIAASLSYQDPAAAQMAEQIEKVVKLPPVDFYAASKK